MKFNIDGIKMRLSSYDLDGDGITGGTENVQRKNNDAITLKDTSELGEALEHQNKDTENDMRLSSVDFISRINEYQHAPITAVEFIASAGVISRNSRVITRIIKRNAVSLGGKGRTEFVDVVTGKKQNDIQKSIQNMAGSNQQK